MSFFLGYIMEIEWFSSQELTSQELMGNMILLQDVIGIISYGIINIIGDMTNLILLFCKSSIPSNGCFRWGLVQLVCPFFHFDSRRTRLQRHSQALAYALQSYRGSRKENSTLLMQLEGLTASIENGPKNKINISNATSACF